MTETDGFGIDGFDRTVERLKRELAAREAELAEIHVTGGCSYIRLNEALQRAEAAEQRLKLYEPIHTFDGLTIDEWRRKAEEAAKDADAAALYGNTGRAHGFVGIPKWSELAEETRQIYREAIAAKGEALRQDAEQRAEAAERDEWKEAVLNELIVAHIYTKEHETNPLKAIRDAITWNCQVALDPAVSSDAQRLRDTYLQRAEAAERELAAMKAENSELRSALEIVHFKREPWQ